MEEIQNLNNLHITDLKNIEKTIFDLKNKYL